jgi:hypothetical protein
LAAQLGLGSVEELEAALDAFEGVAEDGGEINDNLAREARVRAAYMEWCRQFNKTQDETRFKVFENNYLTMEEYSQKSDKEMNLNAYADCTKEEYAAVIAKKAEEIVQSKEKAIAEAKLAKEREAEAKVARERPMSMLRQTRRPRQKLLQRPRRQPRLGKRPDWKLRKQKPR